MDRYSASISLLISKGGSLTRQLTNALTFSATTTGDHDSAGGDGGKRFRALQDKDGHYSSRLGSTRLLSDVSLSLSLPQSVQRSLARSIIMIAVAFADWLLLLAAWLPQYISFRSHVREERNQKQSAQVLFCCWLFFVFLASLKQRKRQP